MKCYCSGVFCRLSLDAFLSFWIWYFPWHGEELGGGQECEMPLELELHEDPCSLQSQRSGTSIPALPVLCAQRERGSLLKHNTWAFLWVQMCGYLREANVPWLEFPMDPSLICPAGSFRMRSPLLTLTPIPGEIHFPLSPFKLPC